MAKNNFRTDRDLNRVTLHRMHRIFERIRAGDYPNRRKLADELEVSQKTIHRDIEYLKDFHGIPIEYDVHNYGYRFSGEVGEFPLLKLTEGELFAIFVAEKALEQYVGTPFEKPLRNTFKRFTAGLSGELSVQWSELQSAISFKGVEGSPVDAAVFQQLALAIRQNRDITFDYRGLKDSRHQHRHVRPYELVMAEHQWYLFAFDVGRDEIRRFVPSRLRNLQTTKTRFVKPRDFSAGKLMQHSFGIFSGGSPVSVRILFDSFASRLIRERHWHPSQQIVERNRGKLELLLTLGGFEEVERWILSWGQHARVLDPPELIARLRTSIQRCLKEYEV